MRKEALIVSLILLFIGGSSATFIGTSPGVGEHGTLERGETYQFSFNVLTSAGTDFTITPAVKEPRTQFFEPDGENDPYEFDEEKASREDISDWVSFSQTNYRINPETEVEGTNAEGQIDYFIEVPRDAEPGYHAASIVMNNNLNSQSDGTIATLGVIEYSFVFKVPGEVEKRLTVDNIRGLRSGDDRAVVELDVTNEGSVTVMLENYSSSIYTTNGEKIDGLEDRPNQKIAPGEKKTIQTNWFYSEDITAGEYRLRGSMDYMTGSAFLDDSFDISSFIEIEPSNNSQDGGGNVLPSGKSGDSPPMMLIVIFLVLSGALLYAFEVDPLLIIMVLGMISIASFIWFAGLPIYLIGLVVITSAGIFYYGWM